MGLDGCAEGQRRLIRAVTRDEVSWRYVAFRLAYFPFQLIAGAFKGTKAAA